MNVTQLVLAGIATNFGVETTVRHAYELGSKVALAGDAITDVEAEAHANSVECIVPALGGEVPSPTSVARQIDREHVSTP